MKTFSFSGRATRREFWNTVVTFIFILVIAGPLIDIFLQGTARHICIGTLALIFLVGCIAAAVRRAHDLGLSGWQAFNPLKALKIAFGDSI